MIRGLIRTGALAAAGVALWDWERRRDLARLHADAEWGELNRPLRGRSVAVRGGDGAELHAEVFGPDEAPTIVLVHGWTCNLTFWHYQIRDLSRYFRIVAYDQRGHGASEVPQDEDSYSADTLAGDLQAVLDATVPQGQRCVVAGHSMGGMTIVAWAGRHPEAVAQRLAAAALVNTGMDQLAARLLILGPRVGSRIHQAVIPPLVTMPRAPRAMFEPISLRLIHRIVAGPDASPGRVAFMHRMVLSCPAPVRAGFGRLFTDLDLSGSVPDLDVPTTVIAGELDRLLPPWHSQQLAGRLPQLVELVELPRMGHMCPIEAPEAVTATLRQLAAGALAETRPSPVHAG